MTFKITLMLLQHKEDNMQNIELAQPVRLFATFVAFGKLSFKGGDPAPPSGRATLLRLHPSHQPYLTRFFPCG